jgi:transposase
MPEGWHFTEKGRLTPPELLDAWHQIVGPADSDLTDEEWNLLVPLIPARRNRYGTFTRSVGELDTLRKQVDGIRYKFARDIPWAHIPGRYGVSRNIYQRYVAYRRNGVFAKMQRALQAHPKRAASLSG